MRKFSAKRTSVLSVLAVLILCSCRSSASEAADSSQFSTNFMPFNLENVDDLESVAVWHVTQVNTPISKIRYNISKNKLIVVVDATSTITIVVPESGKLVSQTFLDLSKFHTFNINSDGSLLLGGVQYEVDLEKTTNRYEQIAIWNTSTGLIEKCITGGCLADMGEISEDETDLGAVADGAFENLVSFDEDTYSFSVYSNNELVYSGYALVNNLDSDNWKRIGDIAIDSANHRLAIIYQEGEVRLDTISHSENTPLIPFEFSERLNMYDGNQPQEIQMSTFDADGHLLAVVRGGKLAVWDADGWNKKQLLVYEVGQIHGLSFDMQGALLFVGVEDQVLIFGLKDKEIIAQLSTPNISTLCISEDNRLLFWGDVDGNVHVWGIK